MKKFFLGLGVACMTLSTFASTRVLYQQNFETATDPAECGWQTFGGELMSIASDNFGKFLEVKLGQNNGRSTYVKWGQDIFLNEDGSSVLLEDGEMLPYSVKFDFAIANSAANQYNSEITIFTNHDPIANNTYRTPWTPVGCWDNYLFDMSQVANEDYQFAFDAPTVKTTADDGTVSYSVDTSLDPKTLGQGTWYTVEMEVNVETREVEYSVVSLAGDQVAYGTRTVPETDVNGDPISMYGEGLFLMLSRYQSTFDIDNIMVSFESAYDYATVPTIALTRVGKTADEALDLAMRAYTINFMDGETLHVIGTDGKTEEAEYADCDGAYVYETTTSGTLKAWTTSGTATSETVEVTVDCAPIVLPSIVATISSVAEGFGKTYTLTVDNSEVPLRPTIFIDYEFVGKNGESIVKSGEASGCKVTVTEEGTLKLTSAAFGYESKTITVNNDVEYATKKVYDFARMTKEEISAKGFPAFETLNSATTSGFSNWTARKRLYYQVEGTETVNDAGETVYDVAYPFGFLAEDNTTNVIEYSVIDNASKEGEDAKRDELFEGLTIFPKTGKNTGYPNVGMMYRIGLFNNETLNNNNNIIIHDLEETDFVVVNYINNYGGNSCHPIVADDEAYFAQLAGEDAVYAAEEETTTEGEGDSAVTVGTGVFSVTYPLYRVDTACTKITVFKQISGAVEGIEAAEVAGDNFYYTIDGLRVAQPTRPGLYIHNGKKIIVK